MAEFVIKMADERGRVLEQVHTAASIEELRARFAHAGYHIFSIKVDGDRVWIGTENGLAMYNKKTGQMKSWTEKDGLPWHRVVRKDRRIAIKNPEGHFLQGKLLEAEGWTIGSDGVLKRE